MSILSNQTILGRTGLKVGRLGISSSFGAPANAIEEAFARGCNYFTWGTFIKGRSPEMAKAIQNLVRSGQREQLVLAMFSYAHHHFLTDVFFNKGLKALGLEYADVLLLGYFNQPPRPRLIEGALKLREQGKVRFIGISSHNRRLFPILRKQNLFDVFHLRYNAAHRGAETETFPFIGGDNRPGVVSFTATRWRSLLKARKMPKGEHPPTAADCYRFVLSQPAVDVCMMGAKNEAQMRENLSVLTQDPMSEGELERMRRIGDYLHHKT
jgi:predicted aldo/keto reductase-like oxidoreductase